MPACAAGASATAATRIATASRTTGAAPRRRRDGSRREITTRSRRGREKRRSPDHRVLVAAEVVEDDAVTQEVEPQGQRRREGEAVTWRARQREPARDLCGTERMEADQELREPEPAVHLVVACAPRLASARPMRCPPRRHRGSSGPEREDGDGVRLFIAGARMTLLRQFRHQTIYRPPIAAPRCRPIDHA